MLPVEMSQDFSRSGLYKGTVSVSSISKQVLNLRDAAPGSLTKIGIHEKMIWLVVEPTHLKNISQIGFIFPK